MILYSLVCGHLDQGTISDAKRLVCYCHECGKSREITRVITSEWFARCYDCKYRRWFGVNQELAKDNARRHANKYPQHRASHAKASRPASRQAEEIINRIRV